MAADQRSRLICCVVRAEVSDGEWQRLGRAAPVPGMPVEAFIQTGERTALAYLTKPFMDQVSSRCVAFRLIKDMGKKGSQLWPTS